MTKFRANPHRNDGNHDEIVKALRDFGIAFHDTGVVGKGFPDGVASYRGVNVLLEFKMPGEQLNAAQAKFLSKWGGPLFVVRSGAEAVKVVVEAARPCACRKGVA